MPPRRPTALRTVLAGTFLFALLACALNGSLAAPERWEYSEMASNILQGKGALYNFLGADYYFYGSAPYTWLLAAVLGATNGREFWVVILHALLLAMTVGMVYRLARMSLGKKGALAAAALAALHPGGLIYAGKLVPQTLDVFLVAWAFLLVLRIRVGDSLGATLLRGFVFGVTVLERATVGPFFALWAGWFLWKQRRLGSRAVRLIAILACGGAAALAPVVYSGYRRYGRLIPLRTDTGENLWSGTHAGATGTSYTFTDPPVSVREQMPPELAGRLEGLDEVGQNEALLAAAGDFIRTDPVAAGRLFFRKLYYFWWFSPHTGIFYPAWWTIAYRIYYSLLIGFAAIGIWAALTAARKITRERAGLFLTLAATVSLIHALFYVEGRHRWQIESLLIIYACAGLLRCRGLLSGRA